MVNILKRMRKLDEVYPFLFLSSHSLPSEILTPSFPPAYHSLNCCRCLTCLPASPPHPYRPWRRNHPSSFKTDPIHNANPPNTPLWPRHLYTRVPRLTNILANPPAPIKILQSRSAHQRHPRKSRRKRSHRPHRRGEEHGRYETATIPTGRAGGQQRRQKGARERRRSQPDSLVRRHHHILHPHPTQLRRLPTLDLDFPCKPHKHQHHSIIILIINPSLPNLLPRRQNRNLHARRHALDAGPQRLQDLRLAPVDLWSDARTARDRRRDGPTVGDDAARGAQRVQAQSGRGPADGEEGHGREEGARRHVETGERRC